MATTRAPRPDNDPPYVLPIDDGLLDDAEVLARINEIYGEQSGELDLERFTNAQNRVIREVTGDLPARAVTSMLDAREAVLGEINRSSTGFHDRLNETWGEALDLLALMRLAAMDAGQRFSDKHGMEARREGDSLVFALLGLHGLACAVTEEVIVLLRTGHASGAHARWRTIHEAAVVSLLLSDHGSDLARRYLDHDAILSWDAVQAHRSYAEALHLEPYPEEAAARVERRRAEMLGKYGPSFGSHYGWAAEIAGTSRPSLGELERLAELQQLRPEYSSASHAIHPASVKSITSNLGAGGPT